MPPNGTHPMLPQPKMDSPSYYNYSPHPQDPQSHMVGMHPGMPNGQSQLSPSGNPHKRRKHGGMSSMSSTEDDVESTGDDTEHMSNYYGKSPMSNQSAGWQEQPMDPGMQPMMNSVHHRYHDHQPGAQQGDYKGDTLSDFVSLVCQEANNSQGQSSPSSPPGKSPTKMPHYYSPGMLPPPPPPPTLARPVAILRTSDGQTVISSNNTSSNAGGPLTSSSQNMNNNSPGTPPGNRAIMSSPFSVLSRPEHAFAHIHPQGHQVFSYASLSPVNAFSGVISPTTLSLITSPVATPRTTPRSTPIPRWTTPFGLPLDDNMDYNSMLANMMHVNPDEPLMNEDRIFPVIHNTDGMDQSGSNTGNGSAGQAPSHTSPNQGPSTPGPSSSKTQSQASPQT